MKNKINISIPKPCSADWEKMSPSEKGRHCKSCDKTVLDFTNMNAQQITDYLFKNREMSVCGRINNNLLSKPRENHQNIFIKKYTSIQKHIKNNYFSVAILILISSVVGLTGCEKPKKGTQKKLIPNIPASHQNEGMIMGKIQQDIKCIQPLKPENAKPKDKNKNDSITTKGEIFLE